MTIEQHIQEYSSLPEEGRKQVDEFTAFLKSKLELNNYEPQKPAIRRLGLARGMVKILPGFDDPIEGFEEYM